MYELPVGFYFGVEFGIGEQNNDHLFQEVGGLSAEVTLEEYQEGGLNQYAHRMPTGTKYGNLVLRRGMFNDSKVAEWCRKAIENFIFEPTDVTVTLFNEAQEPLAAWNFIRAYPVKWSVSDFKAQDNALVIESIELAYSSFKKDT